MMLRLLSLLAFCAVYAMSQDVEIDAAHSSICHQLPYLQHYCGSQIRDCYDCSKVAQGKPGHTGPQGPPGPKGDKVLRITVKLGRSCNRVYSFVYNDYKSKANMHR